MYMEAMANLEHALENHKPVFTPDWKQAANNIRRQVPASPFYLSGVRMEHGRKQGEMAAWQRKSPPWGTHMQQLLAVKFGFKWVLACESGLQDKAKNS